ncbi:MAG: BatD family protein [Planctomycetes bacterium]|nr:BatD family protein [Planctomycetota bacterium]
MSLRVTLLLGLLASVAPAQMRARCSLSDAQVFEGQAVVYDVVIRRATDDLRIDADPEVEGLAFERVREGIRSQGFTSINGRLTQHKDWGGTWRVRAEKAGTYTIPMPKVTSGGQIVPGHAVTLTVQTAAAQDAAKVVLSANATSIVLGQAVGITVDVLLKHLPAPARAPDPLHFHDQQFPNQMVPPQVVLPWLPTPPFGQGSLDIDRWARSVMSRGKGLRFSGVNSRRFVGEVADVDAADANGEQARYRRYRFYVELRADQVGTFAFSRAMVEGSVAMRSGARFREKHIFARSEPLEVTVSEAPADGRPDGFAGAVGRFALTASPPTPSVVAVGNPVYFTLVIEGHGFLDGVEIDVASQLGDGWRVEPPKIIDALAPGEERPQGFPSRPGKWRQFDYKLRPLRDDIRALPPIRFAYFDTDRRSYKVLLSPEFPIEVKPAGADIDAGVVDATGGGAGATELVAAGLSANEDDLNKIGNQRANPSSYLVGLAGLLSAWIASGLVIRRRRQLQADPTILRRRGAPARAARRLKAARAAAGAGGVTEAVAALCGLVADLEDRPEDAVTSGDVARWAAAHLDDVDACGALDELLASGEMAAFGGGGLDDRARARLLDAADLFVRTSATRRRVGVASAVVALLALAAPLPAQDADLFQQAQNAFAEGRYADAAGHYEAMSSDDYENGYVLYNMGNAWMNAGERGRAISAYRRAQWLLPGDANLERNLELALERRRQDLSVADDAVIDKILFWRAALSFSRQANLALLFFAFAFVFSLIRMLRGTRSGSLRAFAFTGLVLALLFTASAILTWTDQASGAHGAITDDDTRLLQWPSDEADLAYEQPLHDGDEFTVLQDRDGWLKIRVADRYEGWVPSGRAIAW